jgi:hypothetical protein
MKQIWGCSVLAFVVIGISGCGSAAGNNRQLRSIIISQTVNGQQIQFVATGTFSAPPTTVSPLPAFWSIDLPPQQYTLTTQPFVIQCTVSGPVPGPIVAWAPANPRAPSSGLLSATQMVASSTGATCP